MSGERVSLFGGRVTWFFGPRGAHVRLPGWLYSRNSGEDYGYGIGRSWRVLGLVCIRHNDTRGGELKHCQRAGWTVTFMQIRWQEIRRAFRKADNYVS